MKPKKSITKKALPPTKGDGLDVPKFMQREDKQVGTTKSIHIISTNTTSKVLARTERAFVSIVAAKLYLEELSKPGKLTSNSTDGTVGTLDATIEFETNYDVRKILKGIEPKTMLPSIIREKAQTPRFSSPKADKPGDAAKPTATPSTKTAGVKKHTNGKVVVLKQVCQELKIEPRKARQKLRALEKAGKLKPDEEGRWQWPIAEVDKVKALLLK